MRAAIAAAALAALLGCDDSDPACVYECHHARDGVVALEECEAAADPLATTTIDPRSPRGLPYADTWPDYTETEVCQRGPEPDE